MLQAMPLADSIRLRRMRVPCRPETSSGFKRYIQEYGMPMRVYLDKHTTYKANAKPQVEDALNNTKPLSEFERALGELGVHVIHANSPQAKGRIERLFGTLQDHLVKELRLKGVNTEEDAN